MKPTHESNKSAPTAEAAAINKMADDVSGASGENPPRVIQWSILRRAVRESVSAHRSMFAISMVIALVFAATTAGLAFAMNSVVNDVFVDVDPGKVTAVALFILVISTLKGGAEYFHVVATAYLNRKLLSSFQRRIFRKYLVLDVNYFSKSLPAKHVALLLRMSKATVGLVLAMTSNLARDVLTLLALGTVMLVQEPLMALIVALSGPPYLIMLRRIGKRVRDVAQLENEADAGMPVHVSEAVQGLRIVKAYGLEDKSKKSFDAAVQNLEERSLRISRTQALLGPVAETSSGVVIAALILYAAWQEQVFGRSAGEMVSFIAAFLFARGPARRIGSLHLEAVRKTVAVEQMYKLFDTEASDIQDRPDTEPIQQTKIEFQNVTVRYTGGQKVIDKVSFELEAGESLAIVGRSGAGKSTLANALLGFSNVKSGQILINGRDVSKIARTTLLSSIGYVFQDPFLFEGSIRDNILDGRAQASDADILEAARVADVDSFLPLLKKGLDSEVGPNGTHLSGGQRQRVALARAVLRDAPLVLLDEATSAMDGDSEAKILTNVIHTKRATQTVICISHRYASVAACSRVIMLENSQVVEDGTPAELHQRSELFRSIMGIQQPE